MEKQLKEMKAKMQPFENFLVIKIGKDV